MSEHLFLPVKPKWAELIMSGQKTLELRKRLPSKGYGNQCLIYSSSPRCEIVGAADVVDFVRILAAATDVLSAACVTRTVFDAYFGEREPHAIKLRLPVRFSKPVRLETLRTTWSIEPPQQWRYIDGKTFDEIVEAGQ